jgi:hypothetical protein
MTDHDRLGYAQSVENLRDEGCLIGRRCVGIAAEPFAPSVSGAIDEDNAPIGGKLLAERKPHVLEIAACAVQQQHGRPDRWSARREVGYVQATSIDRDHTTGGRVSALNASDTNRRYDDQTADNRQESQQDRQNHSERHDPPVNPRTEPMRCCRTIATRGTHKRRPQHFYRKRLKPDDVRE